MKRFFIAKYLLLASALGWPLDLAARRLACESVQWQPVEELDKVYSFEGSRRCLVERKGEGNLENLIPFYVGDIKAKALKVHSEEEVSGGIKLDVTDDETSEYGKMLVRYDKSVVLGHQSTFSFESVSTEITAEGNAKNTKHIGGKLLVARSSEQLYLVEVIKKISILKPSIAPRDYFIRRVKESLEKGITSASERSNREVAAHL